jgi:uncharacterized protein YjgD (DUF1641 family)
MELISILKELKTLDSEISKIEETLSMVKKRFNELESSAASMMLENDIDVITIAGVEFRQALPAFKITGEEVKAFQWLNDQGYSEAIKQSKETINHMTLSKILRERLEADGIESIPSELFTCVNTNKLRIKEK